MQSRGLNFFEVLVNLRCNQLSLVGHDFILRVAQIEPARQAYSGAAGEDVGNNAAARS